MVKLLEEELNRAEEKVDAFFEEITPPAECKETAIWRTLTLVSDRARLLYVRAARGNGNSAELATGQDRLKYTLKYALVGLNGLGLGPLDTSLDETTYELAANFFETYEDYDSVCVAFSSARAGTTSAFQRSDGAIHFKAEGDPCRIASDVLDGYLGPSGSPADPIVDWFLDPSSLAPTIQKSLEHMVNARAGTPSTLVDLDVLAELDESLPRAQSHIPESWSFGSSDGLQLRRALRQLSIYAVYHTTMVTLEAVRTKAPFCGAAHLVGLHSHNSLCELISSSGMCAGDARDLCKLLEYGVGVRSPDPALQFFVRLSDDTLAVPWPLVASCDVERNFLSLLARCRKVEFDRQSSIFEKEMVGEIRSAMSRRRWQSRFNKHVPTQFGAEEVDIIVLDSDEKTCLVAELRWTLPPGDVNEVAYREREVSSKVEQVRRKARAVESAQARAALLAELNISVTDDWNVRALVVFENFLPTSVPEPFVPVISQRTFLSGISRFESLSAMLDWFDSGAWLPVEEHFRLAEETVVVGNQVIIVDSVSPTDAGIISLIERHGAR